LDLSPDGRTRIASLVPRKIQRELNHLASSGIHPITHADSDYPERYRQRLKDSAPAVLFYAGEKALLGQPGIAVVGSRHLDDAGKDCAAFVGNACGLSGMVLYSGGAKGVDTNSTEAALEARGTSISVLADSLTRAVKSLKDALSRGDLCLITP
jgi:DNA processing protein